VTDRAPVVASRTAPPDSGSGFAADDEPRAPAGASRWARTPLGAGVAGVVLAALLAPAEPLTTLPWGSFTPPVLPIELRWLAAFLLFVLLPGWLLVGLLLPSRTGEHLETAILASAAGYSLAVLLGLALHAVFRPVAPWQIAAGGGLLVLALALAILFGLLGVFRAPGTRGVVVSLTFAILLAALTWNRPRVVIAIGALLALALVLRTPWPPPITSPGMRVALVWAAGPLFVHLLLIRVPGTHFREIFPGLILILAALAGPVLTHSRARLVVGALLAALVVGAGHYSWVTLVQRQPEYQLAYPTIRHPLDWTTRDGRGIGGVFGTVHRHGWKALGVLMADGGLAGGYATNESPAISAWYLRQPQGCEGTLAYIFRVQRAPHDRNLALPVPLPGGYQTRGRVREHGRPTIAIHTPRSSTDRLGRSRPRRTRAGSTASSLRSGVQSASSTEPTSEPRRPVEPASPATSRPTTPLTHHNDPGRTF
jgi:hypothetical protein